jgi:DNA modification methylase
MHEVVVGDVLETLCGVPDRAVQSIITSPPFWGLRSYLPKDHPDKAREIGTERTPQEYVEKLVAVFREARRVLRDDGTLWLNLGDSYAANRSYQVDSTKGGPKHSPAQGFEDSFMRVPDGLKPKDLVGIPWTVALALRADGWWLRSDIIWAKGTSHQKAMRETAADAMREEGVAEDVIERVLATWEPYVGNCMPGSLEDRPVSGHEYLFLLSKSERYYYDYHAVREGFADARHGRDGSKNASERNVGGRTDGYTKPNGIDPSANGGRNMRSVWTIPPQPFPGSHFAVFPEKLVEPCLRAGTSAGGCCAACGASRERVVEKGEPDEAQRAACGADASGGYAGESLKGHDGTGVQDASAVKARVLAGMRARITTSWAPTCACSDPREPVPCLVMDPFGGSGTVAVVANREGRDAVIVELNEEFAAMARERITNPNYAKEERARQRARREAEKAAAAAAVTM